MVAPRTYHSYLHSSLNRWGGRLLWVALLAALFSLSGCQSLLRENVSADSVAIVVSSRTKTFSDVANHLKNKLGEGAKVLYLSKNNARNNRTMRGLNKSDKSQIVAIGLRASRLSKQLSNKQVVFCQVFNYRQFGLVAPYRKGVSAVPPPYQSFRKWKKLSPNLKKVLTITGPTHRKMIRKARLDARRVGIELKHMVVGSDKEFIYTYKQNADNYQGLWLLPDNRVLSRNAIHSVMSFSVKNGKQVMVFSPQLLQIGGLVSATAVSSDVAEQVYRRLQDGSGSLELPGPAVTHLSRTNFEINNVLSRQFGLSR